LSYLFFFFFVCFFFSIKSTHLNISLLFSAKKRWERCSWRRALLRSLGIW
jgi:hypothetical protein